MSLKTNNRVILGIVACVVFLILGIDISIEASNVIDPMKRSPILIFVGNLIVFFSIVGIALILRFLYLRKKKQEKSLRRRKRYKTL